MIATMDGQSDGGTTAAEYVPASPEDSALPEMRCPRCESLVPRAQARVEAGPRTEAGSRTRHISWLCNHCSGAFGVTQVRQSGAWADCGFIFIDDEQQRDALRRSLAPALGETYLDGQGGGGDDEGEVSREAMIARLDQAIAQIDAQAEQLRAQRSSLMGVTPAERDALGTAGGGQFPFTGGDTRHLVPFDKDEERDWEAWGLL